MSTSRQASQAEVGFDSSEGMEEMKAEADMEQAQEEEEVKQASARGQGTSRMTQFKTLMGKANINMLTLKVMAKGAVAPTIALGMCQSSTIAFQYTTLGYLIPIVTGMSFAILPRAKFAQQMMLSMLGTCLGAALSLLATYCCVHARLNTEPKAVRAASSSSSGSSAGATMAPYNSSACVVAAVWLFVEIYLINALRARFKALMVPGIIMSMFANISLVYAPQFDDMSEGVQFQKKLLQCFVLGFGVGTGSSLFIFPMTVRGAVFMEFKGYIELVRGALWSNIGYINSLERADMFARIPQDPDENTRGPEAQKLKGLVSRLASLQGVLAVDLKYARRETAFGYLHADDLQDIFEYLRALFLPILALSSVVDVFERYAMEQGWNHPDEANESNENLSRAQRDRQKLEALQDWHALTHMLKEPFMQVTMDIDQGLQHAMYNLNLAKAPPADADVEAGGGAPKPGQAGFVEHFGHRINEFHNKKGNLLRNYCKLRGIDLPADFFYQPPNGRFSPGEEIPVPQMRQSARRQLYLVLYMDFLLDSIGDQVYDFVLYTKDLHDCGRYDQQRIILPSYRQLRKLFSTAFSSKEDGFDDNQTVHGHAGGFQVYLGDAFHARKDPEHLPPVGWWQKSTDKLRILSDLLRSTESIFGFRCAVATMCLGIVSYLRTTQTFYVVQRLYWSQIMVSISMTPSTGESIFSFLTRIIGTFLGMVASYVSWYVADQQTPGVIILFFFTATFGFWFVMKWPKMAPVGMIYAMTNCMVIGYELQVSKIGVAASNAGGQVYYPTYIFAPYRLATVVAGIFLAWIWTIIPFPISEHSELRKTLGSSLYLVANYYSIVHETVKTRIRDGGHAIIESENDPRRRLEKERTKVFTKTMLVLQELEKHSGFVTWDISMGGKFPKPLYDKIIRRLYDILSFTSLLSYASHTFETMQGVDEHGNEVESESAWLNDFRKLIRSANITSRESTTLLSLLSASVMSGQPLPPYLKPPRPYALSDRLEAMDKDILSVRHLAEPGFAAFACMQIGTKCISDDLALLLKEVQELVGVLDFSFSYVENPDAPTGVDGSQERLIRPPPKVTHSDNSMPPPSPMFKNKPE